MKLIPIFSFLIFAATLFAGNKNADKAIIDLLDKHAQFLSEEQCNEAGDEFSALSELYSDQWLPNYYAAYYYIFAAEYGQSEAAKNETLNKAESILNKGLKLQPDNSELLSLKAYLQIKKKRAGNSNIKVSSIESLIKQAINSEPKNPRAHLVSAVYKLYFVDTATGKENANKALELFERKTESPNPSWGKNLAQSLSRKL